MKARIRKTGEVVEIISYSSSTTRNETLDKVSYIDSRGKEHPCKPLNFYWDFEQHPDVEEYNFPNTDWNQVRIEAAISAMQGIISRNDAYTYKEIASQAVGYADALVKELKNNVIMNDKQNVYVVHIETRRFFDECQSSYLPEMCPIFGVYSTREKAEREVWDYFTNRFKEEHEICLEEFDIDGERLGYDVCFKRVDKAFGGCAFYCVNFYLETIDV